jgi:hypothetical protein
MIRLWWDAWWGLIWRIVVATALLLLIFEAIIKCERMVGTLP